MHVTGLGANAASRAGFQVKAHGFIQFALKKLKQLIANLFIHVHNP
jgi:hypothetical protein